MKIFGYSERGAMNALFYGMALDKEHGEESMKTFIKDLAKKVALPNLNCLMSFHYQISVTQT